VENAFVTHDSVAARRSAAHRDKPQLRATAIRQQRFRAAGMRSVRATSDHEQQMSRRISLPLLGALLLAVVALAGCGGNASHALPTTSDGRPATVGLASTGLGDVLVDRRGRKLYLFARDSGATSACTGACAVNWPPLRVRGTSLLGSGAKPSDVGRTARPDGISQLTYNGHPLYTFVNDKQPGDTNGEGINAFGGSWFAVSPAGTRVAPRTAPQGGGGYGSGY
jgi:predicted lipoprotein with Yx(FWY)xxD motif